MGIGFGGTQGRVLLCSQSSVPRPVMQKYVFIAEATFVTFAVLCLVVPGALK